MKKFVFVSDFDGTMTDKDFYHIVIDKRKVPWGVEHVADFTGGRMPVFAFLSQLFQSLDLDEDEILEDILSIPFDDTVLELIEKVKAAGGDFIILSAGTSYYIEKYLTHKKIEGITVLSNKGVYHERGIQMQADIESPFYSEISGIDKAKVVADLKTKYPALYYAGDSEPDVKAALLADQAFAKSDLQHLLTLKQHPFVPFCRYNEVTEYLIKQGMIE